MPLRLARAALVIAWLQLIAWNRNSCRKSRRQLSYISLVKNMILQFPVSFISRSIDFYYWTAKDHSPKVKDIIWQDLRSLSVCVSVCLDVCLSVRRLYATVLITQTWRSTVRLMICTAWCRKRIFWNFWPEVARFFCIPVFLSYCLPG